MWLSSSVTFISPSAIFWKSVERGFTTDNSPGEKSQDLGCGQNTFKTSYCPCVLLPIPPSEKGVKIKMNGGHFYFTLFKKIFVYFFGEAILG